MNGRLLPLIFSTMILVGSATVAVPLMVDRSAPFGGGEDASALPAAAGSRAAISLVVANPFGSHHFERMIESGDGIVYGIATGEGLLISYDRGRGWVSRNDGLPRKLVYPNDKPVPRELTSVTVDPARPGRVAVTTPRELFVSDDNGLHWSQVPTDRPTPKADTWPAGSDHFTAASFDPANADGFLLGTSFGGFYGTSDRGRTWSDPSRNADFLRRGAGMYEEVAAIAWLAPAVPPTAATGVTGRPTAPFDPASYDPTHRPIVVGEGFGGRVVLWNPATRVARDLACPGQGRGESIRAIWMDVDDGESRLVVTTDRAVWNYRFANGQWDLGGMAFIAAQPPAEPSAEKRLRMQKAANRTGIYVSSLQATSKHMDRYLDFVTRNGMNSIVVDCKEDFGIVTYDSRLELPLKMGAVKVRFNLDDLVRAAHNRGVYLIARVLVFKDRLVYAYDNYSHAVWDREKNAPWANLSTYQDEETGETSYYQREHWTDPFDPFVTDYNIAIAHELEERGVDEIQFDYIRFPTDGNLAAAVYRHRKPGMNNVDALESFLAKARRAIGIPISTDVYGFNAWHQMGTTNGQSAAMFSRYVDVISPMFYPNHFPLAFKRAVPYFDRAAQIYLEGTERAQRIVAGGCLIRPYVQAFLLRYLPPEESLDTPQAGELLVRQLRAAQRASSSGYTLWNASNDYYMVTASLQPYEPGR